MIFTNTPYTFKIVIQGTTFEVTRVQDGDVWIVSLFVNGVLKEDRTIDLEEDGSEADKHCFNDFRDTLLAVRDAFTQQVIK